MIGDIAADVAAARAAGTRGIIVPVAATRRDELPGLPAAASLAEAVAGLLAGRMPPSWPPGAPASAPGAAVKTPGVAVKTPSLTGEGQQRW